MALINRLVVFLVFSGNQDLRIATVIDVTAYGRMLLIVVQVESFVVILRATFGGPADIASLDSDVLIVTIRVLEDWVLAMSAGKETF